MWSRAARPAMAGANQLYLALIGGVFLIVILLQDPDGLASLKMKIGRMQLRAVVVVYRRVFQKAFEPLIPYGVGLIELDAGPRLLGHVPNPDDPAAARAGERAVLRFTRLIERGPAVPTLFRLT